jgi:uncharacterized protein
MNSKSKHISQLIRKHISAIDPSAEVILYGSRARGDNHIYSDWDLLILTDYQIDVETERKFRNELYNLELETGESISVFAYSRDDWQNIQRVTPFYQNVMKEGVKL